MNAVRALMLLLLLAAWGHALAAADTSVAVPPLQQRVTDLTGSLDAPTRDRLEAQLRSFEARKGSQIAVLLVPTTQPESIEQFAIRVAEQWKLGRSKVDDGAILLIATQDRTLRIEVGYGLEGVLNDATAKRIISETIVPRLRAGDLAGGVDAGVSQILAVIDGEPLPPPPPRARAAHRSGGESLLPLGLLLAVVLGGVLRAVLGRLPAAIAVAALLGVLAWFLVGVVAVAVGASVIGFLFTLGGGGGRGGIWLGGGGGFGGGGSGGGGGFSGGGGGFGGGGASGRW